MEKLVEIISNLSTPLKPLETDVTPKLPTLSDIRCVLFDVYGTLMVSGVGDISHSSDDNRAAAIRNVAEALGFTLDPALGDPGQLFKKVILEQQDKQRERGITYPEVEIREVWYEFLKLNGQIVSGSDFLNPGIAELSVRFELSVNRTWPMPGLPELLENLRENKIHLGIVSNAQFFTPLLFAAYLGKTVDDLGFEPEICQWSYAYKEAKPSERLYQINADILQKTQNISPEQVLYVGNDMLNDITPAQSVGFKTALFAGDQRSLRFREKDDRVRNTRPDLIVTSLEQLVRCIL